MYKIWIFTCLLGLVMGCKPSQEHQNTDMEDNKQSANTFGDDLNFLSNHHDDLIVLSDDSAQAQVIVAPQYQGRVMTSTAGGKDGISFGWINYDLIASGEIKAHFNPYGGEDRFWMGPEGGQYAIFFKEGDSFVFEDWQTPSSIDTEAFDVLQKDQKQAVFSKLIELKNYKGTTFKIKVDRKISLLNPSELEQELGIEISKENIQTVAFASDNQITNQGKASWEKENGLLSIWILGMFKPSPSTNIIIPYKHDTNTDVPAVNDSYFGKVPQQRLKVEDGHIFFKGDGKYRSKIGVAPERAKPIIGSYDAEHQVLTIVKFTLPEGSTDYVNSMWEMQEEPFGGDAVNAYNDGPLEGESGQMGPFYELESSSPAKALAPGASIQHRQLTVHFSGTDETLDQLARELLGVGLSKIRQVF